MNFFRQLKKPTLLYWTMLLSLSILCAQGVKLHVHGFEHEHENHHEQIDTGSTDHTHVSETHFADDMSHVDHHDSGVTTELDISPDGLLKKVSSAVLTLALVVVFFFLLLPTFIRQKCHRCRDSKLARSKHYFHSPPLRAPPQY